MKKIKTLFILCLCCSLLCACSALDNILPELPAEEKDFCISAIKYFEQNANNLNGENLKIFTNNMELILTHEAALEKYGQDMTDAQKNAYWAVTLVNHFMPRDYELTDQQIATLKIDIDENSMRGFLYDGVFIKGTLSFADNPAEQRKIQINMHVDQPLLGGSDLVPIITSISFED